MPLPAVYTLVRMGAGRRYAFRQQPQVCYWNLLQLAAAFVRAEILEQVGLPWSTLTLPWCSLHLLHFATKCAGPGQRCNDGVCSVAAAAGCQGCSCTVVLWSTCYCRIDM